MSSKPMGLLLSDLSTRAGSFLVDSVSQQVSPGQILAVVGPSGCGKTTLLHAISGMRRCRGTVAIDGVDVTAVPPGKAFDGAGLSIPGALSGTLRAAECRLWL